MLNITTKTTDDCFTTTAALKARLFGTTSTSTASDVMLNSLIKAASRWAEAYVGQPLTLQGYEETVATYGTRRLMLTRTPLRALHLYESTDDDAYEISTTQFRLESRDSAILTRAEGWPWTVPTELELEERPLPGEESQPWYATYVAGYTYNGITTDSTLYSTYGGTTDTGRTLPEDIEEAVLLKARLMYDMSVDGAAVSSEKLGDLEVNYRTGGTDRAGGAVPQQPEEILLDGYRRIV